MRASHPAAFLLAPLTLLAALSLLAPTAASAADATPVPGGATTAAPTPKSGLIGIDVMTGTVFQEGQSSFSGLALRARLKSAALLPNVEILPAVEYWQNKSTIGLYGLETRRSNATLGCQARWVFTHEHWQPYAGAGLGLHFLDEKVSSSQLAEVKNAHDSTVRGGLSLLGGATFTMTSHLANFVELEYHAVSHYRQVKFNTGVGWTF